MDWIKIIERLDWNNEKKDILSAKCELMEIPDGSIHMLVQPLSKYHWENAAEVIVILGVDRCLPIINEMLRWLQDMNWPGAMQIYDMIKNSESNEVDSYIIEALKTAKVENDENWLENINMLIEDKKIGK